MYTVLSIVYPVPFPSHLAVGVGCRSSRRGTYLGPLSVVAIDTHLSHEHVMNMAIQLKSKMLKNVHIRRDVAGNKSPGNPEYEAPAEARTRSQNEKKEKRRPE